MQERSFQAKETSIGSWRHVVWTRANATGANELQESLIDYEVTLLQVYVSVSEKILTANQSDWAMMSCADVASSSATTCEICGVDGARTCAVSMSWIGIWTWNET